MRLWSLHPQYLDRQGLLAVWREALLAKKVLSGKTIGYTHHPQLIRFQQLKNASLAINTYLDGIYLESVVREYSFDRSKVGQIDQSIKIEISSGQLRYEFRHLLSKLKARDRQKFLQIKDAEDILPHKMFQVYEGEVEEWERVDG